MRGRGLKLGCDDKFIEIYRNLQKFTEIYRNRQKSLEIYQNLQRNVPTVKKSG